jgi:hypothetical protein
MKLSKELVHTVLNSDSVTAWKEIGQYLYSIFSQKFSSEEVENEIIHRDRDLTELEHLLANSAWELWLETQSISKTSDKLKDFWNTHEEGKCILVLDALSLRELPYFIEGAEKRNISISAQCTFSEFPSDTNTFANAIGFPNRSALSNNSNKSKFFSGAFTESVQFPWLDCIPLVQSKKDILFWHHLPDVLIHDFSKPGEGLEKLSKQLLFSFRSEDFWKFIRVLLQGRKLIITGDHGYASTGYFSDIKNNDQINYLKSTYKNQRYTLEPSKSVLNIPPIDLTISNNHKEVKMVLGRYKWKSSGGYPTLSHGGLSLLEMFVPYMELQA